jgi:hypothetical protein
VLGWRDLAVLARLIFVPFYGLRGQCVKPDLFLFDSFAQTSCGLCGKTIQPFGFVKRGSRSAATRVFKGENAQANAYENRRL